MLQSATIKNSCFSFWPHDIAVKGPDTTQIWLFCATFILFYTFQCLSSVISIPAASSAPISRSDRLSSSEPGGY